MQIVPTLVLTDQTARVCGAMKLFQDYSEEYSQDPPKSRGNGEAALVRFGNRVMLRQSEKIFGDMDGGATERER